MILDRFALTGRVAIITGAGRGIGKGIALAFAEAGADMVLIDITPDAIERAVSEVEGLGRRALAVACDVREPEQIDLMVSSAMGKFGRIDVLVNNAGGTPFKPTLKTSPRTWEAIVRQNLTATFLCSKAVSIVMLDQKNGSIINISSRDSQIPSLGMAAYGAAKAGVNSLTKTLAWELAPYVRVNAILPGAIWTEGSAPVLEPVRDRVIANTPLKRIGRPEDIALAAIYLASSASDWVTGKLFEIDGGIEFVPAAAEEMG
ncbi:MAG: SDR family oxidoreductase [Chloroflexi bacterium]|nr:SDR family oxidoreductase [Chloroflexota bacterium]